jgi:hypothetical protein
MIPTKEKVLERAKELFYQQAYRSGMEKVNSPEDSELVEGGFYNVALSELMTSTERKNEQWLNIDFPENFSVDVDLLFDSGGLILGSKHTGKSDLGFMIADKCTEKDAVVVVFDPSLDWIARSSIKQYLKVEPYAVLEVPKKSIVYDISLCSPQEQQKILENFSKKLFEYQAQAQERKQYLLILEEAHTYFPQGCIRSKSLMNAIKLISVGRNIQIATLLLSQFSSVLDKYLIKHNTSQIWLGYSREPNDLKYLRQIIGDNVSELPKLNDGEFLYLTRSGIQKIAIEPYNSATPKTQFFSKIPQLEPIKPIQQKANNDGIIDIVKFITCAGIVIYAIINMPK